MIHLKYGLYLFLALMTVSPVHSHEGLDLTTHLTVTGLVGSSSPFIVDGKVIFTYTGPERTRFVGVAFEHEQFATVHGFSRNANGVFFSIYHLPADKEELLYRFVVDGIWQADPANADTVTATRGIRLSRFAYRIDTNLYAGSPIPRGGDRYEFHVTLPPGRRVALTGTFNDWDPFMHQMTYDGEGRYVLTIRLPAGLHYYAYVVDGRKIRDPLNPDQAIGSDGREVSVLNSGIQRVTGERSLSPLPNRVSRP